MSKLDKIFFFFKGLRYHACQFLVFLPKKKEKQDFDLFVDFAKYLNYAMSWTGSFDETSSSDWCKPLCSDLFNNSHWCTWWGGVPGCKAYVGHLISSMDSRRFHTTCRYLHMSNQWTSWVASAEVAWKRRLSKYTHVSLREISESVKNVSKLVDDAVDPVHWMLIHQLHVKPYCTSFNGSKLTQFKVWSMQWVWLVEIVYAIHVIPYLSHLWTMSLFEVWGTW